MISVGEPVIGEREQELAMEALRSGHISGTSGDFIAKFEREFAARHGCEHGVACSSGSTALHLAMAVLDIHPGDEVLVSAFTNIATANAVALQGGIVVPVDVDPHTWNMNPALLEGLLSGWVRAILPVHIYGHPVDMDAVNAFAQRHRLHVVEDAAEAHGARYKGRPVGALGDMACFSFYANKIITTGEGGMITTNNREHAARARYLRNLAFGEVRFLHRELGFNYRMTNVQAAIGLGQLERIDEVIARKRAVAHRYLERLREVNGLTLPVELVDVMNVYWMFGIVVTPECKLSRNSLQVHLQERGIETRRMFCPMNLQPALVKRRALRYTECPVAERLWHDGFYLPSGAGVTDEQIDVVCEAIREVA